VKKYLITIYHKGIFGGISTINITNVSKEDKFYQYKENCFIVYGVKDNKSVYCSFPLNIIKCVNIEEV
jgi:hypothetical protein